MTESGKAINDQQIKYLIEQNNFNDAAKRLLEQQKETWPILKSGYNSLNSVKTKRIQFDGFTFIVQFNPSRYNSSSAKVDEKSISDRQCFLCMEILPPEQEGIIIKDYILLANPFPIFPEHFTIASGAYSEAKRPMSSATSSSICGATTTASGFRPCASCAAARDWRIAIDTSGSKRALLPSEIDLHSTT